MSDRYVSHSELATWRRCNRKWYLTYWEGLRLPVEQVTGIRRIGTRIHLALAAHYTPELPYEWRAQAGLKALDDAQAVDMQTMTQRIGQVEGDVHLLAYTDEDVKELKNEFDLERRMMEGYNEWLAETGADEDIEPISAEERVTVSAGIGGRTVYLSGTLDLLIRRVSSGVHLLFDHKTVQSLKQETLHMNTQLKHYTMLDRLRGGVTVGALFNMLRKVKRTASAKPPFYGREEVRFNPDDLRSYWYAVDGTLRQIFRAEDDLTRGWDHRTVTPPNVNDTCTWQCDFFDMCHMMDDGSRWRDLVQRTHVRVDARHTYRDSVSIPGRTGDLDDGHAGPAGARARQGG